jgi:hypothetical protein
MFREKKRYMAKIRMPRERAYRMIEITRRAGAIFPRRLNTAPTNRRTNSTANKALYRLSAPYRPYRKRANFSGIVFRFIIIFLFVIISATERG